MQNVGSLLILLLSFVLDLKLLMFCLMGSTYGFDGFYEAIAVLRFLKCKEDISWGVSTGSLLLGAAGFLHDKKATTNKNAYDLLRPFCAQLVSL